MDTLTKQAIGFGIVMALLFGAGSYGVNSGNGVASPVVGVLFGFAFGASFYVYRKRRKIQ